MPILPGRPVLIATDFSEDSREALAWAIDFARGFDLSLVVLHVVHDPEAAPGFYHQDADDPRPMEDRGRDRLEEFREACFAKDPALRESPPSDWLVVTGLPATRVLEVAEEVQAQLIVVGSTGRTGLRRLLLGSKSSRIAQLSPIPVVIVKRPDSEPTDQGSSSLA